MDLKMLQTQALLILGKKSSKSTVRTAFACSCGLAFARMLVPLSNPLQTLET